MASSSRCFFDSMGAHFLKDAYVALATQQLNRSVAFYQAALEQEPTVQIPNTYAEFVLPGMTLGLFQPKSENFAEFEAQGSGGMSLCWEVNDLEAAIAHITAIGYPPSGDIVDASHGREIYAYDPDGNRLILHQSH